MKEKIHDKGYKRLFSNRTTVLHFLRHYLGEPWMKELKEGDLIPMDKQFIQESFQVKEADVIYQIQYRERTLYFFLLLEFQSTVDPAMAYRLLTYAVEVMRRDRENAGPSSGKHSGFGLPMILPVVLYNGARRWSAAGSLKECLFGPEELREEMDLKYRLVDIGRLPESCLLQGGTLLECVFLLERSRNLESLKENVRKGEGILKKLTEQERQELTLWVRDVLMKRITEMSFDEETFQAWKKGEVEAMISGIERAFDYETKKSRREGFQEGIQRGLEQGLEQGIEQGLERGKASEKKTIARRLAELGLDPQLIQEATGLTEDQVQETCGEYRACGTETTF